MSESNLAKKTRLDAHAANIVRLYEWDRMNILEIAERYQVSATPIRRILTEAGVAFRSGPEVLRLRIKPMPQGARHSGWEGGRWVDCNGYVHVKRPDHPFANKGGYVLEHRVVMEAFLRHYLRPEEHIHHRGGNPSNNQLSNLQLVTASEHGSIHNPRQRIIRHCQQCGLPVERIRSHLKKHVFCSQACRYKALAPLVSRKRWVGKGKEKRPVPCEHCGTISLRHPCHIHDHNFCSVACRAAASRGQKRGAFRPAN